MSTSKPRLGRPPGPPADHSVRLHLTFRPADLDALDRLRAALPAESVPSRSEAIRAAVREMVARLSGGAVPGPNGG